MEATNKTPLNLADTAGFEAIPAESKATKTERLIRAALEVAEEMPSKVTVADHGDGKGSVYAEPDAFDAITAKLRAEQNKQQRIKASDLNSRNDRTLRGLNQLLMGCCEAGHVIEESAFWAMSLLVEDAIKATEEIGAILEQEA